HSGFDIAARLEEPQGCQDTSDRSRDHQCDAYHRARPRRDRVKTAAAHLIGLGHHEPERSDGDGGANPCQEGSFICQMVAELVGVSRFLGRHPPLRTSGLAYTTKMCHSDTERVALADGCCYEWLSGR